MDREGAWALFWATGLPEAWLATRTEADDGERDAAVCTAPNEEPSGL